MRVIGRVTQWDKFWPLRRFAVTGGRDFEDESMTLAALCRLPAWSVLINGGARGADRLAAATWRRLMHSWHPSVGLADHYVQTYPADWREHGRSAGAIRNQRMLDTGLDMLLAFPGGRGTAHMVDICGRAGVPIVDAAWLATQPGRLVDLERFQGLEYRQELISYQPPLLHVIQEQP